MDRHLAIRWSDVGPQGPTLTIFVRPMSDTLVGIIDKYTLFFIN